ncbi:MAG: ribonuclease R [Geminicoccaceae bacterium]
MTKRELARAFNLKGQDRAELRAMLRGLQDEGLLERGHKRRVRDSGRLPGVAVLNVVTIDDDGELIAIPANQSVSGDTATPQIHLNGQQGRGRAPEIGDRVLAKLSFVEGLLYEGRIIKVLPRPPERLIGVVEPSRDGLLVRPLDRKAGRGIVLERELVGMVKPGDVVVVEGKDGQKRSDGTVRISKRLGHVDDPSAVSLLAAHHHDLKTVFSDEAQEAADRAKSAPLRKRTDLRALPLVTIDGADARDFDDAVFAAPDDHPDNPGGWRVTVAIADVAHYVLPGAPLDIEARERGNSTYFPDRVLPMLPEALSNGLCSLRPNEDRACLAVHIWLDRQGKKRRHRFERALMRSHARLTYEQVQAAKDGSPDDLTVPLLETVIEPLFGAFSALLEARQRRGTLDLDIKELKVVLDEGSRPIRIAPAPRLDAHRLIEEFMIIANVAAAEALEQKVTPCMYRVHDRPDPAKLEGLGQLLKSLDVVRQSILGVKPRDLARILEKNREHPLSPLIGNLLLRAQSQAVYTPDNIGHYGLNLGRYAHFTSPIRRYADLIVHRGLIRALGLGGDGLPDEVETETLRGLGQQISRLERRSMEAERSAKDRFVALLMAEQIGAVFAGRITSVQRFGLFVQLDDSLADLLIPISSLSANRLEHAVNDHALVDRQARCAWVLGDRVEVELLEADTAMGRLSGQLVAHEPGSHAQKLLTKKKKGKPPKRRSKGRR